MTITLKELDEVLARGHGFEYRDFALKYQKQIRAALELKDKLEQGFVLVPRELLSEVEEQLVDLFNEKSSRGVMYREREKLFDADILQRVRLLTHAAPPAQGEQDDDDDSDREPCSRCLDRSCNGECMEGL